MNNQRIANELLDMAERIAVPSLRKVAKNIVGFGDGPVGAALDKWNDIHDLETQIDIAMHQYKAANRFRGAPGEKEVEEILDKGKDAKESLNRVSQKFEQLFRAETAFIKNHGTPSEYQIKMYEQFGFR